jgi:Undecaprenyl-phosphate glucose phosphotransferase
MARAGTVPYVENRLRPWWHAGVSESTFLALWSCFDLGLVALTGYLASWLRFNTPFLPGARALAIILAVVIAGLAFRYVKLHTLEMAARPLTQVRLATTAMLGTVLVVATIGFLTKTGDDISRLWAVIWLGWVILAFMATRSIITSVYRRLEADDNFVRCHVLFSTIENLPLLASVIQRWETLMTRSDRLAGIFIDRPNDVPSDFAGRHLITGSFHDFLLWHGRDYMDRAVLVLPPDDHKRLEPLLERFGTVALDVDLIAGAVDLRWATRPVGKVAGLPSVRVMTRPLDARQHMVKRVEDIVIAGIALVVLSPIMLLAALAVKLETPGPVLFRQQRHGFNNQTFNVLKFRSMRHNAVQPSEVKQATRRDPRITRVGAFLRKTSIDELPQLFNVLRGDMSIVGPRPHAIQHNDHFANRIRSYLGRHRVKPGLTGWAQVHGYRGETETLEKMEKRVEYDLYYVDNWSLTLDLRIVLLTVRCVIHSNAY